MSGSGRGFSSKAGNGSNIFNGFVNNLEFDSPKIIDGNFPEKKCLITFTQSIKNQNSDMKKFTLSLSLMLSLGFTAMAQVGMDTLLYDGFEADDLSYILVSAPSGNDNGWINLDADGLNDASPQGRDGFWFPSYGFADVDTATVVMASNSWTNDASTPIQNWLMTPPLQITDSTAWLFWKSASFQTPLYLDGYKVLVSENGNLEPEFTDTLAVYAEYESRPGTDSTFSSFVFSSGLVAGMDGTYIQYGGDSLRFRCELRPDSVSLAAYAGKTIYIAFLADSHDDNLLSIDDILVTGTAPDGLNDKTLVGKEISLLPNPAREKVRVNYDTQSTGSVLIEILSMDGKLIRDFQTATLLKGSHFSDLNLSGIAAGQYLVVVKTSRYTSSIRLIVAE